MLIRGSAIYQWFNIQVPVLCVIVYLAVHFFLFSLTLRLVSIFVLPLIWDCISYWLFWTSSIVSSYNELRSTLDNKGGRYSSKDISPDWYDVDVAYDPGWIFDEEEWHHGSVVVDKFVSTILWILCCFSPIQIYQKTGRRYRRKRRDILSRRGVTVSECRRYFKRKSPAYPLSSHDYFWLQDTAENPCQIVALAVTDRLTVKRLKDVVSDRWVSWDTKFSSVLTHKFGRNCWSPLGREKFELEDHVYEKEIDTSRTTIHEALSELASTNLPANKPRWRMVLMNPVDTGSTDYSCLALQIHHSMGDGVAIAYAVMARLFDHSGQPAMYDRYSNRGLDIVLKTAFYYTWNVFKCAFYGVRVLGFWLMWCPKPGATFQPPGNTLDRQKPLGSKFLAPPVVLEMQQMQLLRQSIGTLTTFIPTVNDVLAYCLTVVMGNLRSGAGVQELRDKMSLRRQLTTTATSSGRTTPQESPSTPKSHLPAESDSLKHICEGLPLQPMEIDMSTPTALTHRFRNRKNPFELLRRRVKTFCWTNFQDWLKSDDPYYHPYASKFEDYLQVLIPMTTRTGVPTNLDNFTGPVLVRLPLFSYTENYYRQHLDNINLHGKQRVLVLALKHLKAVKGEIDQMKKSDYGPVFFMLVCLACKVLPDRISKVIFSNI